MSDLSNDGMYKPMESSSSAEEVVKEESVHETPKVKKPYETPFTAADQVPNALDVEPDLLYTSFTYYES